MAQQKLGADITGRLTLTASIAKSQTLAAALTANLAVTADLVKPKPLAAALTGSLGVTADLSSINPALGRLPLALRQASNAFGQDSPWLPLVTITMPAPDTTVFRLVPNTEDVVFQSNTFTAFPVQIDLPKETAKGEIPTLTLRLSNVTRVVQGHLEVLNGGIGATVELVIVNTAHLSEDYAELTLTFDVLSAECTPQWVSLKCGPANPMRRRFPLYRYIARYCNWQFKGVECGYTGSDTICRRSYDACKSKGNLPRFGGFPGLDAGGLRVA